MAGFRAGEKPGEGRVSNIFLVREQEKRCFYLMESVTVHIFVDGFTAGA